MKIDAEIKIKLKNKMKGLDYVLMGKCICCTSKNN